MKKTIEIEVEIPETPNYLRFGERKTIPIEQFSKAELEEVGRQWTENLLKKALSKITKK